MVVNFINSMLLYCLLLSPFYIIIRLFWLRLRNNHPIKKIREATLYIFFLYCVSIFSQTIIPKFSLIDRNIEVYFEQSYVNSNFIPFKTISMYVAQLNGPLNQIALFNLLGNIVLFIPFGLLLPLLWTRLRSKKWMGLIAIGIPVFIEGTQYFIGRSVDIDDVILNAVAILGGYILFVLADSFTNLRRVK